MTFPLEADFDRRLRQEAMAWLTIRTNDGVDAISTSELEDFEFDGRRYRLMDRQRGIRKPAELSAALSIRTVYTPASRERPYEDEMGSDGLLRYKWRGDDAEHPENRALRAAMERQLPLLWFFGVGPAVYKPIYPVYLLWEARERHEFVIDPDVARGLVNQESRMEEHIRRYIVRETKQRLHQPVFRASVLRAYETRCAVCALHHSVLLDAAHIVPDREEDGIPAVRNGLALCKIHHAAYDSHILGVRPDLVVQIRRDLLEEIDGPMLQHGLQERHGQPLMAVPRSRSEKPDPQLLDRSYTAFLAAG
ncbi:MAG TPA: HNH endonuclease signature motif containing protein [Mycobacteriales bacterium]|nr:HNH endonuclease signature motif containing protein [Mycobacteriales bacterium]